ncbi:hypothetical protein [Kitasatospora sp. NPDC056184]|uniref:hypothetical protein n=1 Tax=Kitasatospora sp. NPDC056184 TaxID=3345738 RepID=UPI0035D9AD67
MPADDRVTDLIAEAARRREAQRQRRTRLDTARRHGLAARHRLKLARLDQPDQPTTPKAGPEPPEAA